MNALGTSFNTSLLILEICEIVARVCMQFYVNSTQNFQSGSYFQGVELCGRIDLRGGYFCSRGG